MMKLSSISLYATLTPHKCEFQLMIDQDIFEQLPDSVIAHQILAELYLTQESYQDAIKTAEAGLERLRRSESLSGKPRPL
jgi:hypothetical protein